MKRLQQLFLFTHETYGKVVSARQDQSGFIPMILTIIFVLAAVIYFAFKRVLAVQR